MNEERIERLACELADALGEYGDELMIWYAELMARPDMQAALWQSRFAMQASEPFKIVACWQSSAYSTALTKIWLKVRDQLSEHQLGDWG